MQSESKVGYCQQDIAPQQCDDVSCAALLVESRTWRSNVVLMRCTVSANSTCCEALKGKMWLNDYVFSGHGQVRT